MKFKIFTVTKNEYDLIEDFIIYYGSIFGYENIVIIDNGSDNEIVLDIYKKYLTKGINLYTEFGYTGNLQGDHFTKYMNKYKNDSDWLIGLDTDEFMIISENEEYSCIDLFDKLKNTLENLDPEIDKIKFSYISSYCPYEILKYEKPAREIILFNEKTPIDKYFYRSKNFYNTIVGNHNGTTKNNKIGFLDNISYIHYQDTGTKRLIERASTICIGYNYISKFDDEYEILKKINFSTMWFGIHRVTQIYNFNVIKCIINLFVEYIKRIPNTDELNIYITNFNLENIKDEIKKYANNNDNNDNDNDNNDITKINLENEYYISYNKIHNNTLYSNKNKIVCISNYLNSFEPSKVQTN